MRVNSAYSTVGRGARISNLLQDVLRISRIFFEAALLDSKGSYEKALELSPDLRL